MVCLTSAVWTMKKKYFCDILLFVGLCLGVSNASECTARGRFPNDESADCRGYTMCLIGGLTNFTQYKLMCPVGSVYSHIDEQCTNATNYKCYPNFNCTSVGNFAAPESTDCSWFVTCIEGLGSVGTARMIACPPNMLFESTAGVCVNNTEFTCTNPEISVNPSVQVIDDDPQLTGNAVVTNIQFSMLFFIILLQALLY